MRSLGLVIALSVSTMLAACVPMQPPPPLEAAPVCYSKPQCDAMWSEAMIQVQNLSGMRLQTATETYIQTFNATEFNRMTAAARRLPKPDGSTVIDAGFRCDYCGNQVFQAYNLFVMSVKAAGSGFPVPASAQGNGQPEETVDQMLERLENGK